MGESSLKEKTAKGLFWGGFSNGAQQLLNLGFGIVLARLLDASDYGMIGMLAIFSAIAGTLQESGFTVALANKQKVSHEDYKPYSGSAHSRESEYTSFSFSVPHSLPTFTITPISHCWHVMFFSVS